MTQAQRPLGVEPAMQALLDLIESNRARLCEQILGEAQDRARALRRHASAGARTRMRQAFEEQRLRRRERLGERGRGLARPGRAHAYPGEPVARRADLVTDVDGHRHPPSRLSIRIDTISP